MLASSEKILSENERLKQELVAAQRELLKSRRNLEALRKREASVRYLLEHTQDVIFTMDFDLNFMFLTQMILEHTGYTREEWKSMSPQERYLPESLAEIQEQLVELKAVLEKGELEEIQSFRRTLYLNYYHRNGSIGQSEVRYGILIEGGVPTGVIGVTRNFTERNLTLKALEHSESKLKQLNKTKDKLFSIIAHDLRTPLNNFMALLELTRDELLSEEEFKALLRDLSQSAFFTYQLLDNLLHWSRNQMEAETAYPRSFFIDELIETNLRLFGKEAQIKNLNLGSKLATGARVRADRNMIDLVLRNLIANAIKFTRSGGYIRLETERQDDRIVVRVSDTGVGISQDALSKILGEGQYSTRGTKNEKGTGLGLVLCREYIEKNGGTLKVESEEGKGAVFSFELPLAEDGDRPEE